MSENSEEQRRGKATKKRRRMFTLVKHKFKSIRVMPSNLDGVNFRTMMWVVITKMLMEKKNLATQRHEECLSW